MPDTARVPVSLGGAVQNLDEMRAVSDQLSDILHTSCTFLEDANPDQDYGEVVYLFEVGVPEGRSKEEMEQQFCDALGGLDAERREKEGE
ncbi:MAG: hypothetical protein AAF530_06445 [Pseudomonadota bacterium]